jgi:hypothetical protein
MEAVAYSGTYEDHVSVVRMIGSDRLIGAIGKERRWSGMEPVDSAIGQRNMRSRRPDGRCDLWIPARCSSAFFLSGQPSRHSVAAEH